MHRCGLGVIVNSSSSRPLGVGATFALRFRAEVASMAGEIAPVLDGKYRLLRKLGKGSMGSVYLGENTSIGRHVAVKVMNPELADHRVLLDRFEREARAAARIRSPHVVEVLDMAEGAHGLRYIVMEHLEGESLGDRLERSGTMSLREVSLLAMQILEGVRAVHDAGIIHRDLKPDNVFLATHADGEIVKILDFGVSKLSFDRVNVTRDGTVMGTPNYMSPEQARGKEIDVRSDLYAVAVLLYESVSGRLPFHAHNVNELLFKIALEEPVPLEAWLPGVDREFAAIIRHGMARDPDARFQSAPDFQNAIALWRDRAFGFEAARGDLMELAYSLSGDRWSVRKARAASAHPSHAEHVTSGLRKSWVPQAPPSQTLRAGRWGAIAATTIGLALALPAGSELPSPLSHDEATRTSAGKVLTTDDDRESLVLAKPELAKPAGAHPAAAAHKPAKKSVQFAAAVPDASTSGDEDALNGYRASPYDALPY
jgi:serine/threonine protein kinase